MAISTECVADTSIRPDDEHHCPKGNFICEANIIRLSGEHHSFLPKAKKKTPTRSQIVLRNDRGSAHAILRAETAFPPYAPFLSPRGHRIDLCFPQAPSFVQMTNIIARRATSFAKQTSFVYRANIILFCQKQKRRPRLLPGSS